LLIIGVRREGQEGTTAPPWKTTALIKSEKKKNLLFITFPERRRQLPSPEKNPADAYGVNHICMSIR